MVWLTAPVIFYSMEIKDAIVVRGVWFWRCENTCTQSHPLPLHCKTCKASPAVVQLWQGGRKSNQSLWPGPQYTGPKPTRGGLQWPSTQHNARRH